MQINAEHRNVERNSVEENGGRMHLHSRICFSQAVNNTNILRAAKFSSLSLFLTDDSYSCLLRLSNFLACMNYCHVDSLEITSLCREGNVSS